MIQIGRKSRGEPGAAVHTATIPQSTFFTARETTEVRPKPLGCECELNPNPQLREPTRGGAQLSNPGTN